MAAQGAQTDRIAGHARPAGSAASGRALIIEHDPYTRPGLIGEALRRCGLQSHRRLVVPEEHFASPGVDHDFPDPLDYDVIVPMGAPWSVFDTDRIGPWIRDELVMLRSAHDLGVPVLGICFGAQALSVALGGTARRSDGWELGWHPVRTDDPLAVPAGPWFQFHQDTMTTPPGAVEIARNDVGPQAWRLGRSLAVQFHPELTPQVLDLWLNHGGEQVVTAHGLDVDALRRRTRQECADGPGRAQDRADILVRSFLGAPPDISERAGGGEA